MPLPGLEEAPSQQQEPDLLAQRVLPPGLPGLVNDDSWQDFVHQRRLQEAREEAANTAEQPLEYLARRSVPLVSAGIGYMERRGLAQAQERLRGRQARPEDYETIARYEQTHQQPEDTAGMLRESLARVPAMAGEGAMAAPLIGAGAAVIGARLAPGAAAAIAHGGGAAGAVGRFAAQQTVAAPLMPSMYVEDWQQRGGRLQDLPPALGHAALANIVIAGIGQIAPALRGFANTPGPVVVPRAGLLGRIGRAAESAEQPTIRGLLERAGIGGGVMAGGSAVTDSLEYALGLSEHKGTLQMLMEGRYGEAAQRSFVSAVTGSAFSLVHQPQGRQHNEVIDALGAAADHLRRQGYSNQRIGEVLERAQANPAEAPAGPVREYARMSQAFQQEASPAEERPPVPGDTASFRNRGRRERAPEVQPTTPVGEQVGVVPPEVGVAPPDVRAAREAGQAAPVETAEGPEEATGQPRIDPAAQWTVEPSRPVQRAPAPSGEAGSAPGEVTGGERAPTTKPLEPTAQQRYATLNDRERLVYDSRTSDAPKTLAAIARKLGVSREMARQIEQSAVKKMGGSESLETLIKREAGEREALLRGATEQIRESAKEEAGERTVAEGMTGNVRDPEQALNRQLDDLVDRLSRQEIDPDTFAREAQRLQAAVEDVKRVPLTDLEKRTLIGGGQENATSAERNTRPARITALANAMVDAERVKGKLPPLMRQARLANPEAWAEAMRRIEADPGLPQRLVNELAQQSRSTTVHENAILLHEKIRLASEYRTAILELIDLWQPRNKGRLADRATAEARERDLLAQVDRLDRVTTDTGTEWGRAGQFRKQLAAEDYSLAGMMQKAAASRGQPLTEAEKAEIARMAQEIESLQKRLEELQAAGSGEGNEAVGVEHKIKTHRDRFDSHVAAWRRASRPWADKLLDTAMETGNVARSFLLGLDFPPALRQGAFFTFSHPIKSLRALYDTMLTSLGSAEGAFRLHRQLQRRENWQNGTYKRMGLQFTEANGRLNATEEAFISRWLGKIPLAGRVYQSLERANVAYMNRIRADYADLLSRSLTGTKKVSDAEAQLIGNMVNVATGRGSLGPSEGEKSVAALTQVFLSPRFTMSRFQLALAQPALKGITRGGNWKARRAIVWEYARAGTSLLAIYGLAAAAGLAPSIETDNRSSNFMKLRVGNTYLDVLGGVQQAVVAFMRIARGEKKTQSGRIMPLRGFQRFGDDSGWDVAGQFVRGRMTPAAGLVYDPLLGRGRDPIGRPVDRRNIAERFEPLSIKDIREALADLGAPRGLAVGIFALFGGGAQTMTPR